MLLEFLGSCTPKNISYILLAIGDFPKATKTAFHYRHSFVILERKFLVSWKQRTIFTNLLISKVTSGFSFAMTVTVDLSGAKFPKLLRRSLIVFSCQHTTICLGLFTVGSCCVEESHRTRSFPICLLSSCWSFLDNVGSKRPVSNCTSLALD